MARLSLLSAKDLQRHLAASLRTRRRALKLSRAALAEKSSVPAPTIKRFELSGEISLRQLLLLWQCVDDLQRWAPLWQPLECEPRSIAEVLGE